MVSNGYSRVWHDRLYGPVPVSEGDWRLFQTPEMVRLRGVSLSAIPPPIIPISNPATRFEHSVGAGYLASIVEKLPGFEWLAPNLRFATYGHDGATPPFSHLSEHFLVKHFGLTHEQYATNVLLNSAFAEEVARQGGNMEVILSLIQGRYKPWSDLLAGSLDSDNMDNVARYGLSTGTLRQRTYSPEKLAKGFVLRDDELYLSVGVADDVVAWAHARMAVYQFVYSPANLLPGSMIHRAIQLAFEHDEIDESFFRLTDAEAMLHLRRCNKQTQTLIDRAHRWEEYLFVCDDNITNPSPRLRQFCEDKDSRSNFADAIANTFSLPREDVLVYAGKSRGVRKIHLELIDHMGKKSGINLGGLVPSWVVQVYLHSSQQRHFAAVSRYVKAYLAP